MNEHVLITPLGRSPGAVSGMAIALSKHPTGFALTRVIAIGTSHPEIKKTDQILIKLFEDYTEFDYQSHLIPHHELREADDSARDFMIRMGLVLEEAIASGAVVHVGVTGGRSGMGALAAMATNIYGADYLWHLWVSADIEDNGRLDRLPKPIRLADNKYLDPSLAEDEHELVSLPFFNLRPYHPLIKQYYREYVSALEQNRPPEVPHEVSPLLQILFHQGAKSLAEVFPPQLPISVADRLVEITRQYPVAPPEQQNDLMEELLLTLGKYEAAEPATIRQLKRLIREGATGGMILDAVEQDADRRGVWAVVRANNDLLQLGLNAGTFLVSVATLLVQMYTTSP